MIPKNQRKNEIFEYLGNSLMIKWPKTSQLQNIGGKSVENLKKKQQIFVYMDSDTNMGDFLIIHNIPSKSGESRARFEDNWE